MRHFNSKAATIWLLLGALTARAPAAAQDAAVSGTVTDTTGFVLPGVAVEARDAAGDQARTAVTDGAGLFTIALPSGTYDVTFTLPGFQDAVRDAVEVGAGATVTIDVELAVELEERVVVVGSRAQPRSVTESQVPIDAIPFQDVATQGMTTSTTSFGPWFPRSTSPRIRSATRPPSCGRPASATSPTTTPWCSSTASGATARRSSPGSPA